MVRDHVIDLTGDRTLTFLDEGPDKEGKRLFFLDWYDRNGIFRPEPGVKRHGPVGFHRAQIFHCDPNRFLKDRCI